MTQKEFVKLTVAFIRELGKGMSNEEYMACLEELSFELDTEWQETNLKQGEFIQ